MLQGQIHNRNDDVLCVFWQQVVKTTSGHNNKKSVGTWVREIKAVNLLISTRNPLSLSCIDQNRIKFIPLYSSLFDVKLSLQQFKILFLINSGENVGKYLLHLMEAMSVEVFSTILFSHLLDNRQCWYVDNCIMRITKGLKKDENGL